MSNDYDAFISYRRGDAAPIAQWIRNRLQRYRLPADILAMLSVESQELHKRKPRVYVDRAYEKSSEDFLERKIFPALDGSQRLIVISTPSVFGSIYEVDGTESPNWLVREIDYFITKSRGDEQLRPIDLVLGPGGSEQRYPGRLAERARWDWIDLRAFNRWRSWGFSEALDAGFTKLIAGIYDVPDTALPLLRREERRRRRNLIVVSSAVALVVAIILSVLAFGWWSETRAREVVDFERRLTIARGLIDIGAIPSAVDVLARLTDESGKNRSPEAVRLLTAWAPRLVTAKGQLDDIPRNTVFRWRGRNYLKGDEDVRLSYEGPPVLQGGVSSSGEFLVAFEADRAFRVRKLSAPSVPLVETKQLDAKPGTISELFQGRLLLFEAGGLALHSDEDEEDAQFEFGRVLVLLDPQTKIYATVEMRDDDRQFVPACDRIWLTGENVHFVVPNKPDRDVPNGLLIISDGGNGPIRWELGVSDPNSPTEAGTSSTAPPTSCPMHVLVAEPDDTPAVTRVNFTFPKLIDEKLVWARIGRVPAVEVQPRICVDETSDQQPKDSCYDTKQAVSTDPQRADSLEYILKDSWFDPELLSTGSLKRILVMSAVGNQAYGFALCELDHHKAIRNCLVTEATARSKKMLLADSQFLVLNGPEVHAQTFQLIDTRTLRFLQVTPPPMERLADVAISADGRRMATLTAAGEVWLYDINRESATAKIASRFDFRGMIGSSRPAKPTEDAPGQRDEADELFNTAVFVSGERLALAGTRGGVVLAAIPSGKVVWTRSPVALSGEGSQTIATSSDTLIIYDRKSMQLISLTSGALLSNVVNFDAFPLNVEDSEQSNGGDQITLKRGSDGEITVVYRGVVYAPVGLRGGSEHDWSSIEQRTGLGRIGTAQPLTYFLGDKPGTSAK